jgi:hypothetical protein
MTDQLFSVFRHRTHSSGPLGSASAIRRRGHVGARDTRSRRIGWAGGGHRGGKLFVAIRTLTVVPVPRTVAFLVRYRPWARAGASRARQGGEVITFGIVNRRAWASASRTLSETPARSVRR